MKIHYDIVQKSPEWINIKKGKLSGSRVDEVFKLDGSLKTGYISYIRKYAREAIVDDEREISQRDKKENSFDISWGNKYEPEAKQWFHNNVHPIIDVGFIESDIGFFGTSPDGIIADGMNLVSGVEFKCPHIDTHVNYGIDIINGKLPNRVKLQVHANMIAANVDSWFFVSYYPGQVPHLIEIKKDKFTEDFKKCIIKFSDKYKEQKKLVEKALPRKIITQDVNFDYGEF